MNFFPVFEKIFYFHSVMQFGLNKKFFILVLCLNFMKMRGYFGFVIVSILFLLVFSGCDSTDNDAPLVKVQENLGADGLPVISYQLKSNETLEIELADGNWYDPPTSIGINFARILVHNEIGDTSCLADDFTNLRIFLKEGNTNTYMKILENDYENNNGGCQKGGLVYTIPLNVSSKVVVCTSQSDGSQNYCSNAFDVSPDPNGPRWR